MEDAGLSGMVALMKMRESRLRCRVSIKLCGDCFSDSPEYGEGDCAWFAGNWNDVSRGDSRFPGRVTRGELGRPVGLKGGIEDMLNPKV